MTGGGPHRPLAHLTGWMMVAAVNAATILVTGHASGWVRVELHAYDLGHCVAAGLCSAGAVGAWTRWGPRRRSAGWLAAWGAAFVVAALVAQDDLSARADKLAGDGSPLPSLGALLLAVSVVIPVAAALGRASAGRLFVVPAVAAAVLAAAGNHLVLVGSYPAIHLFVAWASAVLFAETRGGRPASSRRAGQSRAQPAPRPAPGPARARAASFAAVGSSVLAAWAVGTRPPNAVLAETFRHPGAVFAPFLAIAHVRSSVEATVTKHDPYWRPRVDAPPTPPSGHAAAITLGRPPLVVLLTIDALRADVLEDDRHRPALPALFALRDRGAFFTQARTPAPATEVALTSMFTSRLFGQIRWTQLGESLSYYPHEDPTPRFPALLREAGVPTVQVRSVLVLREETGIASGFSEHVLVRGPEELPYAPAADMVDAMLTRARRVQAGPMFMFAHLLDAHAPYDLAGDEGTPFERYLRELGHVDTALGRLWSGLEEAGLSSDTVLLVTADHGEAFGEHGAEYHGVTVYDEVMRVPLLVVAPGVRPSRIDAHVSLLDLGPTILDLFGRPTPGLYMGQSLVPVLAGEPASFERPLVAESGRHMELMLFGDGHKAIYDRRRGFAEVYDLSTDPGEQRNLYDALGAASAPYVDTLRAFFAAHRLEEEGYVVPFKPP